MLILESATQALQGSTEGSRHSSGQLRPSGEEDQPVQPSSIASPNDHQSATDTDTPLDHLDESELITLKQRPLGVKAETFEDLSFASPPIKQSPTNAALDLLNLSEQLPLKRRSLGVKAETVASPSNLQSSSDFLDLSEELPLTLQPRPSGEEAEPVQLSSIASPKNQQSATDTTLDLLDKSELLPLKQRSLGVKAEQVEALSIAPAPFNQSTTEAALLDPSKEVPLTVQQREAISRRHHLKFITGHYGSGKVTVSCTSIQC